MFLVIPGVLTLNKHTQTAILENVFKRFFITFQKCYSHVCWVGEEVFLLGKEILEKIWGGVFYILQRFKSGTLKNFLCNLFYLFISVTFFRLKL